MTSKYRRKHQEVPFQGLCGVRSLCSWEFVLVMFRKISKVLLIRKVVAQMFDLKQLLSLPRISQQETSESAETPVVGNVPAVIFGFQETGNVSGDAGISIRTVIDEQHRMVALIRVTAETANGERQGSGMHIDVCLN